MSLTLPVSWKTAILRDVLQKTESVNPKNKPNDEFEYIDVSSVSRSTLSISATTRLKGKDAPSRARRLVKTDDIIFATIRPMLQRVAVIPLSLNEQVCSTGYFVFRPISELDSRFFYYYLFTESFMSEMENRQKGASYPAVNDTDIRQQLISYPLLKEQKKIVSLLDEAFTSINKAIENTEKNLVNARELLESYLNDVFTQKREASNDMKIGELANLSRGQNPPKSQFVYEPKDNYVRFYQIRDGKTDKHAVYVPDSKKLHKVEPNDILMVAYRHIGGVFRGVSGAFNVALCKLTNKDEEVISNDYLFNIIPTDFVKGELLKRSERAMIPSMSVKHLQGIKIPVPSLAVQNEIIYKLSLFRKNTNELESIYQQKLTALKELKQSLLQKAFAGELTKETAKATAKG